jgi:hypothetical protein
MYRIRIRDYRNGLSKEEKIKFGELWMLRLMLEILNRVSEKKKLNKHIGTVAT